MQELAEVVAQRAQRLGRQIFTIAESDQNDHRLVNPPALGGYGFDAQWSDDFHHIIHTLLTKEKDGYYQDFGTFNQLVQVYQAGWLYAGDYSPFRQRRHGNSPQHIPAYRLVVCNQNHDQIGNRMLGERLSNLVSSEQYNLAAALLLFSPFIPMLFMGEEYGEFAPFLYFVSHGDPDLIAAVREGRKAEFAAFAWKGEAPDPQDEATFTRSKIDHTLQKTILYEHIYMFYRECIQLRKQILALALLDKTNMAVQGFEQEQILLVHRWVDSHEVGLYQTYHTSKSIEGREVCLLFSLNSQKVVLQVPFPIGTWHRVLNSNDKMWNPTKEYQRSEVPDTVTSTSDESTITLTIDPFVCLVFTRQEAL
jgi:maltooligosyltrehalose trehalohydrolase